MSCYFFNSVILLAFVSQVASSRINVAGELKNDYESRFEKLEQMNEVMGALLKDVVAENNELKKTEKLTADSLAKLFAALKVIRTKLTIHILL